MNNLPELLSRYREGSISAPERAALFAALLDEGQEGEVVAALCAAMDTHAIDIAAEQPDYSVQWQEIVALDRFAVRRSIVRRLGWVKYAAAILLILSAVGYFWYASRAKDTNGITMAVQPFVAPGGNKAVLTLGDGSTIVLDSTASGVVAQQGNSTVQKKDSAQISYLPSIDNRRAASSDIVYNTLTTPRGGQYQLILPDGSRVWLNAASSITYPTVFSAGKRTVSVTGEAYFEVAHEATAPFTVTINNILDVQVLGTRFNVNGYADEEAITTTLLEGKVRLSTGRGKMVQQTALLAPQQEAHYLPDGQLTVATNSEAAASIAWTTGEFDFTNVPLASVLRQLSRWYAVDIRYQGRVPSDRFSGIVRRSSDLGSVLQLLQRAGIPCQLIDHTIIVEAP
jgi:transmembrane sensor